MEINPINTTNNHNRTNRQQSFGAIIKQESAPVIERMMRDLTPEQITEFTKKLSKNGDTFKSISEIVSKKGRHPEVTLKHFDDVQGDYYQIHVNGYDEEFPDSFKYQTNAPDLLMYLVGNIKRVCTPVIEQFNQIEKDIPEKAQNILSGFSQLG